MKMATICILYAIVTDFQAVRFSTNIYYYLIYFTVTGNEVSRGNAFAFYLTDT